MAENLHTQVVLVYCLNYFIMSSWVPFYYRTYAKLKTYAHI